MLLVENNSMFPTIASPLKNLTGFIVAILEKGQNRDS